MAATQRMLLLQLVLMIGAGVGGDKASTPHLRRLHHHQPSLPRDASVCNVVAMAKSQETYMYAHPDCAHQITHTLPFYRNESSTVEEALKRRAWWAWCESSEGVYEPLTPAGLRRKLAEGLSPKAMTPEATEKANIIEDGIFLYGCTRAEDGVFCAELYFQGNEVSGQIGDFSANCHLSTSCCYGEMNRFVKGLGTSVIAESACPGAAQAATKTCSAGPPPAPPDD